MADNTTLNAGAGGDVIATDDIGGVKHQLVKVEYGAADSATQVDASNPLPVEESGNTISTNNSSTATLGISGNFTGTGDDVSEYSTIVVTLDASHDSATDGMTFEFSTDNTNWDDVYPWTYTAADGARRFQFPVTAQYFRVNYTNGGTGQTHFRLQTIFLKNNALSSIHRLVSDTDPDRSAQLMKAAIIAQAGGSGDFVPVAANASGKLQVAADATGDATDGAAHGASQTGFRAMGTDGTNDQQIAVDATGNVQVDIVADAAGLATAANQLPDGHNVTIDNAAGGSAVNVQDGGNSITVDAPVATPVNAQISDGTDTAGVTAAGALNVDGSGVTQPVSAASLPLPTGAATAANQLPDGHAVTVDNAAGASAVNVQDGGNSLTVDQATAGNLNMTEASGATIATNTGNIDTNTTGLNNTVGTDGGVGPSSALSVGGTESGGNFQELRVDTDGHLQVDVLSGGGGGTQYTEDAASAADPVGNQMIARRRDSPAVETTTDGDNTALNCTGEGSLNVELRSGTAETGVAGNPLIITDDGTALLVDGSAVTQPISAASLPLPTGAATEATLAGDLSLDQSHTRNEAFKESACIGGELDDTATTAATEGNVSPARITAQRAVHTNLRNNSGTEVGTSGNPLGVRITDGIDQATVTAGGELNVVVGASTNNIGDVDVLTQPARDRTTDNVGAALVSDALMVDTTAEIPKFVNIDTATSGNNALVAAVAGKTIRVIALFLAASGAVDVYFNDGTGNQLGGTRKVKLDNTGAAGAVGFSLPFNPIGWFQTAAVNRPVNMNLSAAIGVCGCLVYIEV